MKDNISVIRRLDDVISYVENELNNLPSRGDNLLFPLDSSVYNQLNLMQVSQLATRMCATIYDLTPIGNSYREKAEEVAADNIFHWQSVPKLLGILKSLREDYVSGFLTNINELIHSEIFSDILDEAKYLLSKGYAGASAVTCGVVLEEHIRKLAEKVGIPVQDGATFRRAEVLNQDLAKNGVYGKPEQKSVTAWLGIRNDAAHPQESKSNDEMVRLMIEGIRNFIQRYPA